MTHPRARSGGPGPSPRHRRSTLLAVLALSVGATMPVAAAEPPEVARQDQVIVRYAEGTTAAGRRAVAEAHGLEVLETLPGGRTQVLAARGRSVATVRRVLADEPAVVAVGRNQPRAAAADPTGEPGFDALWGQHNTGQPVDGVRGLTDIDIDGLQALKLQTGQPSIVVAVIDEGIDFGHPDLADRAWTNPGEAGAKASNGIDDDGNGYIDDVHGWDFCHDDNTLHDPSEDEHGTHVAGTIAASLDGEGVVGVAPTVKLMSLKFLDGVVPLDPDDPPPCGWDDMAIEAIEYARSFGVRIINASWGGTGSNLALDATIRDSGALFVAAAGNAGIDMDGTGIKYYPAASTAANVISVGAADQSGRRASFSNYGRTSVDLAAPGTNILSTFPDDDCDFSPCWAFLNGTSMAAPHVTGVAALAASEAPSLLTDPAKLRARLLTTGQALPNGTTWTATGRMVNAFRAVDPVPPVAKAPDRFFVRAGSTVGPTSMRITVGWPAATDARTGIAGYDVVRKRSTELVTILKDGKALETSSILTVGTGYLFRLTARDAPRNTTTVSSPTITTSLYTEGTSLATWSSGWKTVASESALGGKTRYATTTGATATFTFTGRSFSLVSSRGSNKGAIKVYVDGTLTSTIDLYRTTSQGRIAVFTASWSTLGAHTVRIVTTSGKRVDVDALVVVR